VAVVRTEVWWGMLKEGNNLEDRSIEGRVLLKPILKRNESMWTGFSWLKTGQVAGPCEHGSEPLGAVKCGNCELVNPLKTKRICFI
jgi:hypothetical protein